MPLSKNAEEQREGRERELKREVAFSYKWEICKKKYVVQQNFCALQFSALFQETLSIKSCPLHVYVVSVRYAKWKMKRDLVSFPRWRRTTVSGCSIH